MRTHGHREGSITHWGLLEGGLREGQWGVGSWGRITWGKMSDIGDGDGGSKPHRHVCTYATTLHVLHMYPRTQSAIQYIYFEKNTKICQEWQQLPVNPATGETGESLEPGRQRLQ